MRNLLLQSKVQLSLFLLLIYLLNLISNFSFQILISVPLAVFSAVVSDFLFLKLRKVKLFFPSAAIASGFIIGLLIDPNLPFYASVLAGVLAMSAKNFIRLGRHIFNPASFGLIFISFFFATAVSWSGVSWQVLDFSNFQTIIPFLILLSPAYVSLYRMKRWRIVISFLAVYSLGFSFYLKSFYASLLDPTLIFFSIVMLPEPMTTPNHPLRQIIFGSFVGLSVIILSIFILPKLSLTIDPLIACLLIGNLIFFKFR